MASVGGARGREPEACVGATRYNNKTSSADNLPRQDFRRPVENRRVSTGDMDPSATPVRQIYVRREGHLWTLHRRCKSKQQRKNRWFIKCAHCKRQRRRERQQETTGSKEQPSATSKPTFPKSRSALQRTSKLHHGGRAHANAQTPECLRLRTV